MQRGGRSETQGRAETQTLTARRVHARATHARNADRILTLRFSPRRFCPDRKRGIAARALGRRKPEGGRS